MMEAPAKELASARALEDTRKAAWVVAGLSLLVLALVTLVIGFVPARSVSGAEPGPFARLNAAFNASATVALLTGYFFIRRHRVRAHRASMLTALGFSSAFLVSYVIHHATVGSVKFVGSNAAHAVYLAILVPHIILAVPVVPLALWTLYRAQTRRFSLHRRIARWTLPVWLYVSVSGVAVYFMLYHLGH